MERRDRRSQERDSHKEDIMTNRQEDLTGQTRDIIARFNEVFQTHDPAALAELVAPDCIIENSVPAPDGARYEGRDACISLWSGIATAPETRFDTEDVFVVGDRAVIRWRYHWGDGQSVRGVNLMRVANAQIVEAMGYVKGG
jgi:ketosteroid isomerase-like protein